MVVLAPGTEIRASDIPHDVLEGAGSLLPVRLPQPGRDVSSQELEFILRNIMDLRLQMEELRRRMDSGPQRVQIIDIGDRQPMADLAGDVGGEDGGAILYRSGMTMAEVEKRAIEAALEEYRGNRRKAAEVLGIGERTLYRKIKAFGLG